ncbi:MAG: transposase [Desulfosoma sp.]
MRYRRAFVPGGAYFFTLNLVDRTSDLLTKNIELLRTVVRRVRRAHPFEIIAWVVLPDHMHAIWHMPQGDADYATRWAMIKAGFSRGIPNTEPISESRRKKGERGLWQRRYWEHMIRDERDLEIHCTYIHYNPVKHGYVARVVDWPFSTFHAFVKRGWLSADWGGVPELGGSFGER